MQERSGTERAPVLVSRTEAMQLLGLSRTAVRKLEDDLLAPTTIGRRVFYELEAVQRLLLSRGGNGACIAFRAFEAGKTPVDVVIEHDIPPVEAERLWSAYQRLKQKEHSVLLVRLPENVTREAWQRAHGYKEINGEVVRLVLELCARDPRMRRVIQTRLASGNKQV